jgi:hypothetical protein
MTRLCTIALCAVASVFFVAGSAQASTEEANCSVTSVGWNNDPTTGAKQLDIICSDGNVHFALVTGNSNCTPYFTDIDTIKIYESLATSAKLAGHTINIWYNLCPSTQTRSIVTISLN